MIISTRDHCFVRRIYINIHTIYTSIIQKLSLVVLDKEIYVIDFSRMDAALKSSIEGASAYHLVPLKSYFIFASCVVADI